MASKAAVDQFRLPPEVRKAAGAGWRLFPIKAGDKRPPLLKSWPTKASRDLGQLESWATQFPECNWGMATGSDSKVFVLDVDGEKGRGALLAFRRQDQELPATLTVTTGSGIHLYFRWPESHSVRNSARKVAEGLDVRGEGGYVVIPPSVHPSGEQYAYVDETTPIACAPDWLLAVVGQNEAQPSAKLEPEIGILHQGTRNDGLTRLGGALRRRGANLEDLETKLLLANAERCRPPLQDAEVLRIAASVALYPIGGPDPLERAWASATEGALSIKSKYERFLALARHLQLARPGLSIALPLQRIGALMGCDWTQAKRWRKRAIGEGWLRPVERYVPHRKAALYFFTECPTREPRGTVPLGQSVPLKEPTSGLVGHQSVSPSGTSAEQTEKGYLEGWL
jgi:hypothetical protein